MMSIDKLGIIISIFAAIWAITDSSKTISLVQSEHRAIIELVRESKTEHKAIIALVKENKTEHKAIAELIKENHTATKNEHAALKALSLIHI